MADMDWMSWTLLVSLAVSLIMGLQTWRAAPRSLMNQAVAALSVGMSVWLVQNLLTLHTHDARPAGRLIRWMSATTALLPVPCHAVRLVIDQDLRRWRNLLHVTSAPGWSPPCPRRRSAGPPVHGGREHAQERRAQDPRGDRHLTGGQDRRARPSS
ncbi:MAG: hypothetical protein U1F77_14620 [Kiritimatiellia bacterium]